MPRHSAFPFWFTGWLRLDACPRHLFWLGLLVYLFPSILQAQTAPDLPDGPTGGSFTIEDVRAPDEVSEVSRLYLNGHLAATFRLGFNRDRAEALLPIPIGRTDLPYTLCGEITLMRNGQQVTHIVSGEGVLHNPDGHLYEAVGDNNFREFFLADYDDPTAADHRVGASSRCMAPNS